MAEDVRPIVGEPTRVLEGYSSYPSVVAGGYWTCAIYGGETREIGVDLEVTPDADEHLLNYKSIRTPVIETLLEYRGGVSEPVPGTDAVLISWVQGGEAFVGWFEGDSAVVVSTLFIYDNRTAIGYLDDLEVSEVLTFEASLLDHLRRNSTVLETIRSTGVLDKDTEDALRQAVESFRTSYLSGGQMLGAQAAAPEEPAGAEHTVEQIVVSRS